jgi:hypothetical protein
MCQPHWHSPKLHVAATVPRRCVDPTSELPPIISKKDDLRNTYSYKVVREKKAIGFPGRQAWTSMRNRVSFKGQLLAYSIQVFVGNLKEQIRAELQ